jgi:hypothetical protein
MMNFIAGVAASILATIIVYLVTKIGWPIFSDRALYKGVRVDGFWEILELRNGKQQRVGKIELKQNGRYISGEGTRSRTREGKESKRQFSYKGSIHGHQVTLLFEDKKGVGFDMGTYVFIVQNDSNTMIGMATFHGKTENRIVSEGRTLRRVLE